MARSDDTVIMIIIAAVALFIGYQLFAGKDGVLESARKAGAAFGGWLQGVWLDSTAYKAAAVATGARGALEGSMLVSVPPTPAGYAPSNWTWVLNDGTHLGLPAGMTPREFCAASPGSPVCAQIMGG